MSGNNQNSKKKKYTGAVARAYILSTFNNTIISVADDNGNVISWSSAGGSGFKGAKKGTPFAAQMAASTVGKKVSDMGVKQVSVFVKGPGPGRETAIRGLQGSGLGILTIRDITPTPHDGCRSPKPRRV
ncbi:MAG: 30S ribosomal protein S11 [Elusimicrobiota bacterium]|jgi:small subunit ribosomal protein S11|nr:30S ribosomal protein S11 [Elusimicrobiota bacterium]